MFQNIQFRALCSFSVALFLVGFGFSVQGSFVGLLGREALSTEVAGGQHTRGVGCALGMEAVDVPALVAGVKQLVLSLADQLADLYLL